jgi:hypothetical protein
MATNDYIYIGKGTIYLDGVPIGNCSKLQLAVETEKKQLPDYESAGGGNVDAVERITSVNAAITAHDLSPANLAVATRGAATAYAGGTVTDEAHNDITVGTLIVFNHIPDTAQTITVKRGATTLTGGGDDYTVTGRSGIITHAGGTNTLIDGDDLLISYTGKADNIVEALVNAGNEYELFFDGLNEAKSGKPVQVKAFKAKPSPSSIDFIADDYAGLELNFEIVKDSTKNGTSASQYFTVKSAVS